MEFSECAVALTHTRTLYERYSSYSEDRALGVGRVCVRVYEWWGAEVGG